MKLKDRVNKLEQETGGQVETEIKVMPEGQEHEFYKYVNGEKIRISESEYNQIMDRQVKAGPVNVEVELPAWFD